MQFRPICLAFALAFLTFGGAALAAPVKFDIPAQPAPSALLAFSKQAGVEVVFSADELKRVQTPAVKGEYEPDFALDLLLKDSGFMGTRNYAGKFVVTRKKAPTGSVVTGTVKAQDTGQPVAGAEVRILDTTQLAYTDPAGQFYLDNVPEGEQSVVILADGFSPTRVTGLTSVTGAVVRLGEIMVRPGSKNGVTVMTAYDVTGKSQVLTMEGFDVNADREKPFVTNNLDLPRTVNDVQPYYIWNASKIESSGASDVQDFFKKMVPMDANRLSASQSPNGQPFSQVSLGGFDGGIGQNTEQNTLILVDGLPLPATSYSTRTYGPNLSGIPLAAIDHIEVLPASDSAIYGAAAIGGVVNIVMKHEYNGAELSTTYNNTFDSDAPKRNVNFAYGSSLEGGRTKVTLTANFSTEKPLSLENRYRQIIGPYQARYFANYPGGKMAYIGLATAAGAITAPSAVYLNQPIIASTTGKPLFAGNSATVVQVPAGYQSFQVNGIGPLQANIGNFDLSIPNTNNTSGLGGLKEPLSQGYENKAVSFGLRRQMTDWIELYAQVGTQTNYSPEFTGYSLFSSVVVPANAPGNPFGQAVKVSGGQMGLPVPGISYTTVTQSASGGARFTLLHEWKADLNYTWGLTAVENKVYGTLDNTAIAAAVANGSLNLITDVSRYPFNASAYPGPADAVQKTSADALLLKAVGPLMKLWAGAPTLAVGVEHQKSGGKGGTEVYSYPASSTVTGVAATATSTLSAYWPGGSATDNSAYAELSVPLVRKAAHVPLVQEFEIQAASRYDQLDQAMTSPSQNLTYVQVGGAKTYNPALLNGQPEPLTVGKTSYGSTNETVGFKYKPVNDVLFRWSYSTAFIPPIYSELVTPISTGTINQTTGAYPGVPTSAPWPYASITDPQLGNAVYTVPIRSGGNPNLKPETSKGMNWGVVFEPKIIKGLRLSLDYVKTTKYDAIITPTAATLIQYANEFPGRVVRGTPNPGQTVGPIVLIDSTYLNAPEISSSSYNLRADYEVRTTSLGQWDFWAITSTWQHYFVQSIIGGPLVENLENPNATSTGTSLSLAKFKGTIGVDWRKGAFTAGWLARYVGPYTDGSRYGIGGAFPTQGTVNGWVSSQIYHDVYVGYNVGKAPRGASWWRLALEDTSIQAGVIDLFNKVPPFDAVGGPNGPFFYSGYGDARLANYYFTFKKTF